MSESAPLRKQNGDPAEPRHRVRLPRFVAEESIGLGDVVKRVTSAVGIAPCSGCRERAARMNRWVGFEPAPPVRPGRQR
jgi:hypothetical protein